MTITDLPVDLTSIDTHKAHVDGDLLATGQRSPGSRRVPAGCEPSATTTIAVSTTEHRPSSSQHLGTGHGSNVSQSPSAGADLLPADRAPCDIQLRHVGGDPSSASPTVNASVPADGSSGWLTLRIWAEMLHDAQKARIAASNRALRGGVDAELYLPHVEMLANAEHACALALRRSYRRVAPPEIIAWQKAERGVGEHLLARLLGHLGDPYIAQPHRWMTDPPEGHECDPQRCGSDRHLVAFEPYVRTVSQLWSYCGHGDAARKKAKGMTADDAMALGNPNLKMLVHLLAEACMKQPSGNRYRNIYEAGRATYAERADSTGKAWSDGHKHAAALRLVGKELLRDLWLARHAASQAGCDTPTTSAGGEHEGAQA